MEQDKDHSIFIDSTNSEAVKKAIEDKKSIFVGMDFSDLEESTMVFYSARNDTLTEIRDFRYDRLAQLDRLYKDPDPEDRSMRGSVREDHYRSFGWRNPYERTHRSDKQKTKTKAQRKARKANRKK